MPKSKKAVTKAPVMTKESVVVVDSKGEAEVMEQPTEGVDVPTSAEVEDREVASPTPDLPTDTDQLARMAARIAELEDQNKKLAAQPQPAAQGQIVKRKNPGKDIVQRTAGGNMRVTHDPSPQLREEMATQEVKS